MTDDDGRAGPEEDTSLLVDRALDGDTAAFRSLYEMHLRRLYALALRITMDGMEAEELTQDVFVTAWRRLGDYRGEALFSSWLHGIAVRLGRQRLRGLLRRRIHEERYLREYLELLSTAMPGANIDLERALATLPRRMRTALVLHAIEGYTQAETGAMMGITEGAVKAHIHRARSLLYERRNAHD